METKVEIIFLLKMLQTLFSNVLEINNMVFFMWCEIISFEKMLKHICKKFDNKKNLF